MEARCRPIGEGASYLLVVQESSHYHLFEVPWMSKGPIMTYCILQYPSIFFIIILAYIFLVFLNILWLLFHYIILLFSYHALEKALNTHIVWSLPLNRKELVTYPCWPVASSSGHIRAIEETQPLHSLGYNCMLCIKRKGIYSL